MPDFSVCPSKGNEANRPEKGALQSVKRKAEGKRIEITIIFRTFADTKCNRNN